MSGETLRVPPHSIEAEQSVIGGLLLDNDAVDRIGDLAVAHFYAHDHRAIFEQVMRMLDEGKPADVVTVFDAMRARKNTRDDLLPYLNSLAQNTPSAANIARYAAIVRDRAIKRGLIVFGAEIESAAFDSEDAAAIQLDAAGAKLDKLAEARVKSDPVRASDDIGRHMDLLGEREAGTIQAIATGFPDLDEQLSGGLRRGEVVVVAARPKMGKTALALNIAQHVAVDSTALVLSMEMPRSQLHDRNLASLGRVPLRHMLVPKLMLPTEWSRVTSAIGMVEALNLFLDDQGALRLLDVRMKARLVKRRHGLALLVIDYLQLMEGQGDNRNAQIEGITRGLKALAKELDIAILLLAQLNRKLEERTNKRPVPSDLRDSGSIEQDADVVLFLYRDEVYNPDTQDKGVCEVDVALNRQGPNGHVLLTYVGDQVRFEPCEHSWRPPSPRVPSARRSPMAHD